MISKLICLLSFISMLIQGQEASIVSVVETIPEITVTFGEEGLLKCAYERKPYAVYWKFLSDSSSINLLVVLDQYYQVGKRSGPGYDGGRYNITNDFSLLIHDVSVEDEGRYICEVSDFETGRVVRNYTNVTVTVQAIRPLVRVHQCGSNNQVSLDVTDNPNASCMIQITRNQSHVQLDCFVEGAKPQVDMSWVDNNTPQDLSNDTSLIITQGKREGTVDQKLTVILEVSEFQSEREYLFTCTAEGQAVGGIASVTVGINKVPPGVPTSAIAAATDSSSMVLVVVVVLVVLVVVVVVVFIAVLLWKKYKRPQHRTDDDHEMDKRTITPLNDDRPVDIETSTLLEDDRPVDIETSTQLDDDRPVDIETSTLLDDDRPVDIETSTQLGAKERAPDKRPSLLDTKRTEIVNYLPDTPTTMNEDTGHINLGVFGLAKAGKSSLINSLVFSLKGRYPGEADIGATPSRERESTRQNEKEDIELTNHIHILNYKGMVKYDRAQLKKILYHIKGQSKEKTPKVPVDCTIFIYDYRNHDQQFERFMKSVSSEVCRFFGRGIMLVIPNKGELDDDDDNIKTKMSKILRIPEDHVWIFENYTLESHEEDVERSIEFLDFILHCLTVAKKNQQFRNVHYGKDIFKR